MNKIYRVLWNFSHQCFVAVSELAHSAGRATRNGAAASITRRHALLPLATGILVAFGFVAQAAQLPTGGQIVAGNGSIAHSGDTLTITQNSSKLVTNWQSFSIGRDGTVRFVQPSADSVALNRVLGPDVSVIQGALKANGHVFLINPNGVLFTPTARVDAAGMVASTLRLSTDDFLAGNYSFEGDSQASVNNQGHIEATHGGSIALVAAHIVNDGTLQAPGGQVLLGAGSKVALDLGGPVKLEVTQGALDALISNGGAIRADGGTVLLTARAAQDLATTVINHTGVIEARSMGAGHNGTLVLLGEQGTTQVAGTIDVSSATDKGGKAIVTGERVLVSDGALVDARGANGGGEIYVGGGWQGQDAAIKQAGATVITAGAVLDASATVHGDGGTVVAWSDVNRTGGVTRVHGSLLARGGVQDGNGGRIETSGHDLDIASAPDVSGIAGRGGVWLIDPYNVSVDAGSGNSNINNYSAFVSTGDNASLGVNWINSALSTGDVIIQTGGGGTQGGDIVWNVPYLYQYAPARTLTLFASRDIILNESISSNNGALSMTFIPKAFGGPVGGTIVRKDLSTNGGGIQFQGLGTTFNGATAQQIATGGGAITFNGEVLLANSQGLTITTNGGQVDFLKTLDSGNSFSYDGTLRTWDAARTAAKTGGGTAVGDTYLATITSALENTAASAAAGSVGAWLGGSDATTEGTWRWVTGPEGLENGGSGRVFLSSGAQGLQGYAGYNGAFVNWNPNEPNNSGNDEDALQLGASGGGSWNDLSTHSGTLGSIVETNLPASPLTINAGAANVSFVGRVGGSKALASLNVTAGQTNLRTDSIRTQNDQIYSGVFNVAGIVTKTIEGSKVTFNQAVSISPNQFIVRADKMDFSANVSGTKQLVLEQRSATQKIELGGSTNAALDTLDLTAAELALLQDGFASVTIGSDAGSGGIKVLGPTTFKDPATLRAGTGGIAIQASLGTTGTDTLTLDARSAVTQTTGGPLYANKLALLGVNGVYQLNSAANQVSILAANTGSVNFDNYAALSVGTVDSIIGVTTTGTTTISTAVGDLTLNGSVNSAASGSNAVVLNADRGASAGTAAGGNVYVASGKTVTVGAGGRATIYTGSIANSIGLNALAGNGSGRFRYNSDEAASNYTAALGSGLYAIYREAPTITITTPDQNKVYDGVGYSLAVNQSGVVNDDAVPTTAGSNKNVGTHAVQLSNYDGGLGYSFVLNPGTITISARPVNVTADTKSKTYGNASPALTFVTEGPSVGRGLVAGDTFSGALAQADENAGTHIIGQGTLANGNYTISYTGANMTIAQRAISLAADAVSKIYGETDPSLTVSITSGSLGSVAVNDTLAEVTGTLNRQTGANVGADDVALGSGSKAGNYAITFNVDNNALTITPAAVGCRGQRGNQDLR